MDFDHDQWVRALLGKLKDTFGDRLLYVGHTGSYARGEATEGSDIDINIVLDRLTMDDLNEYRRMVRSMPDREKACGFICGREEMRAWPRHELFQFTQGCVVLHGSLDGLISAPTDDDIKDSIRNLASGIHHQCCHSYLFEESTADAADGLKFAYKAAFFILQEWVYLTDRRYVPTKREMIERLDGDDRKVLAICVGWDGLKDDRREHPERYFSLMKEWSSGMMRRATVQAERLR